MIPSLDSRGLLPPGVHTCNLKQFQGAFAFNMGRERLFESLTRCLERMHQAQLAGALYLDGSYATDKEHPADIEVTLDVRKQPVAVQNLALVFFMREHAHLDQMGIDWYPTLEAAGKSDFTLYFQYVGEKTAAIKRCNPKDPKGILRLTRW